MQRQNGKTTVEFAIVGAAMFLTLFGVIEIARAFFVWNTAGEMTRRGARVAAVCPIDHAGVARVAMLGDPNGGDSSPLLRGFTSANIKITYLDEDGNSTTVYEDVEHVRVEIENYTHNLIIPFLPAAVRSVPMPTFTTTVPVESLGYVPDDDSRRCF